MRSFRSWLGKISALYVLVIAALFLIATPALRANASGQESGSAQESNPPPRSSAPQPPVSNSDKVVFQNPIPGTQLTFLNHFAGSASKDVIRDKQYRKLMHSVITNCMFHYGSDMPLSDALEKVLDGSPLPVQIRDGRYVMVSGKSGPCLMGRGFMWIDMQDGIALGGFYFRPTNGEPTPTVTIFSKQVKAESLKMSQLPAAFAGDLGEWSVEFRVAPVTTPYFISGSNEKILLEHDEDYCTPMAGTTAPPQEECEQMNGDAADLDENAAYYLEQTNHATNATAHMINGDDQVAWIQVREDTCRISPDPLGCHIRITRERTRVIIHRHPVPNVARK